MQTVDHSHSCLAVTWAGHASVLIELDGTRLLTDPLLGERAGPLVRISGAVTSELCDDLDAVVISHLHADHADVPSLRSSAARCASSRRRARRVGLPRRGPGRAEELPPAGARVDRRRADDSHARGSRWAALPLRPRPPPDRIPRQRLAVAATSLGTPTCIDGMSRLAGQIDLALLPVWGWGPHVGSGHLDPVRAAPLHG